MKPIPGWMTGLIVILMVMALGVAAIIPREVNVIITSTDESQETMTTNYYDHTKPVPKPGED